VYLRQRQEARSLTQAVTSRDDIITVSLTYGWGLRITKHCAFISTRSFGALRMVL